MSRPALVPRQNFYGYDSNFSHNDVNIGTFEGEHDLDDSSPCAIKLTTPVNKLLLNGYCK